MTPAERMAVVVAIGLTAAGCGGDQAESIPSITSTTMDSTPARGSGTPDVPPSVPATIPAAIPSTTTPSASTAPTSPSTSPDLLPSEVAAAVADLAATWGRPADEIEVATVEQVTWRDGSLGCPTAGRSYTQALVAGYRIALVLDSSTHWYHGSNGALPFPCATPSDPVNASAGDA